MSNWNSLEPLTKNIIKTASAAAGVYGIAFVAKSIRTSGHALPKFDEDVDIEILLPIMYDYTMAHALHRIYVVLKREENYTEKKFTLFITCITKLSEFMTTTLDEEDVKKSNKMIEQVEGLFKKLVNTFKDPLTLSIVEQDMELISGAISAHLHNLMMDKFT
ncbi:hypothetical protein [Emiliania huxleyi virus 99B1]|nr:hypothetical protein [Emiliania huxleyi virus 99B1]